MVFRQRQHLPDPSTKSSLLGKVGSLMGLDCLVYKFWVLEVQVQLHARLAAQSSAEPLGLCPVLLLNQALMFPVIMFLVVVVYE